MDYFKQFNIHISNNNYPEFLSLWEEYCASDEIDGEELKKILLLAKESQLIDSFGLYVEHILPLWETLEDPELKHEILCLIYDLQTTNSPDLAERALHYLTERYGKDELFMQKLRLCGLRDKMNFQGALSHFELLNHMSNGNFVFHTGGWGVGEIMGVSLLREQLSIEFDFVSGLKDFSFENAFKTLIPIPKDHFLAVRFGDPDKLEALAKKDPLAVMHRLLRDLGPKTAAEIKDELCELVIPQEEWTRWWQTTRNKMKKDTMIEVPDDLRNPFLLRKSEVTHEEELQKLIEKKPEPAILIQQVYAFLRDFPSVVKNSASKKDLEEKLKGVLSSYELTNTQELQIHFFLEDLQEKGEHAPVKELVQRFPSVQEIVKTTEIVAFKKRILTNVRSFRSDWVAIFQDLFLTIDQNPLRDYIMLELLEAGENEKVNNRLEELLAHPHKYPQALVWYFQKLMHDAAIPFANQEGKNRFFEAFLILFYILEQNRDERDLVKKMYTLLTTGRFANVRKIFQGASKEDVHEFLLLATKCHTITDHDKKILHSLAEVVHPSLKKLNKKYEDGSKADEVIWTTEEGFYKLKERIHQIATVETVENARQIEIARSYGDLRENAEYKSALEQRSRLQSELKRLSDQMSATRILTKADVDANVAGVGVVISCKGTSGKRQVYTLLGPWDADPERNILSFQSKLAKEMEGKGVGETFAVGSEEYTIESLTNYFDKIASASVKK